MDSRQRRANLGSWHPAALGNLLRPQVTQLSCLSPLFYLTINHNTSTFQRNELYQQRRQKYLSRIHHPVVKKKKQISCVTKMSPCMKHSPSTSLKDATLEKSFQFSGSYYSLVFSIFTLLVREMLQWTMKDLVKDYILGFRKWIYQTHCYQKPRTCL